MLANRLLSSASSRRQLFLASGTFTVPSGVTTLYVTTIGPGGDGGTFGPTFGAGGGGAGGGAYAYRTVAPGDTFTVTVALGTITVAQHNIGGSPYLAASAGGVPSNNAGGSGGAGSVIGTGWTTISTYTGSVGNGTSTANGASGASFSYRNAEGTGGAGGIGAAGSNATGFGAGGGGGAVGSAGGLGVGGFVLFEW